MEIHQETGPGVA